MTDFTLTDLLGLIRSCGAEFDLPIEQAMDTPMAELGLDSLAVLQIAALIEQRTAVPIPDTILDEWQTPRRIMDDVSDRIKVA